MNVQHIGRYKCDHVQVSQVQKQSHTPQKQAKRQTERSQTERNQLRHERPSRDLWCAVVCFYYFCANYANAYLYGMGFSADESSIILSIHDWEAYFFNASVIGLTCLCMIAFMPGAANKVEKIYSVTFFISLVLSALSYDDATTMEWWWLDDLDIAMQYGMTAVLVLLTGWNLCRLLRFCYAYLVSLFYE